jgi:Uma2 family endonuclease
MIDPAALEPERVRPLRREEYERLVDLGCFEDEKIELLEGMLVAMSPPGTPHAYAVQQLTMLLVPAVVGRAIVRVQSSFALAEYSEPEPDVVVVATQDYSHAHPRSALLMIEVAESSLRKDRHIKAALYAREGVPEYWIVALSERVIEVYREPNQGTYSQVTRHALGDIVRPQAFPDVKVRVADVIPAAG